MFKKPGIHETTNRLRPLKRIYPKLDDPVILQIPVS